MVSRAVGGGQGGILISSEDGGGGQVPHIERNTESPLFPPALPIHKQHAGIVKDVG